MVRVLYFVLLLKRARLESESPIFCFYLRLSLYFVLVFSYFPTYLRGYSPLAPPGVNNPCNCRLVRIIYRVPRPVAVRCFQVAQKAPQRRKSAYSP